MSTDRKRLSSAIQRIAREDPDIRDIIADYKNRGGVGSASAKVAGADDGRQICCDGSSSGDNNPGAEERDPSEGGQDGLNPDDPANLDDMGPGSLGGVTDCTTGEPVCFEGSDWIPPEGWDSPTEPGVPEYTVGSYYRMGWYLGSPVLGSQSYALSEAAACEKAEAKFLSVYPGREGDGYCYGGKRECGQFPGDEDLIYCSDPDSPEYQEAIEEITPGAWPSDGCINLAVKGGKFVASKYDPDVTSGNGWLKGKEEVELCDEFGNSFTVRASGSVAGGWKSISAQNPGDGYLYNGKGEQIARISGSEYSDPNV